MNRDELLALRTALQARVEERKKLGDFDAGAPAIRDALEACLKLTQHLLDRMRKP